MDYREIEKAINKQAFRRQRHYRPDAQMVVDAGAWIGQTVCGYRKLYPEAMIHAFEPQPRRFRQLCTRFPASLPKLAIWPWALSDREGCQVLHVNEPDYETSLLEMSDGYRAFGVQAVEDVEVVTITLDQFCERQAVERIDVLKLDVQGNELRVLKGARRLFDRGGVDLVFAEMNFWEAYRGQCWWYDIGIWLASYGFELRELAPQWRDGRVGHANGLFVRMR